jgi:hypothetical protein
VTISRRAIGERYKTAPGRPGQDKTKAAQPSRQRCGKDLRREPLVENLFRPLGGAFSYARRTGADAAISRWFVWQVVNILDNIRPQRLSSSGSQRQRGAPNHRARPSSSSVGL